MPDGIQTAIGARLPVYDNPQAWRGPALKRSGDWIYRLHLGDPPSQTGPNMTADRVGARNIGAFAGWQSPNDWVKFDRQTSAPHGASRGYVQGIMHCCTGNGVRALYDAWRNVVHAKGDRVSVNLLLNRTSQAVDIASHLPYVGQVDIDVKRDSVLSVRVPGWVRLSHVRCAVDETPREVTFDGRYAQVGQVAGNQTVRLTFPIAERTDCVTINDERYFLVRKGHDVVFVDPPGRLCPLYQRDHYRDDVTLWKRTSRYLDEQLLDW